MFCCLQEAPKASSSLLLDEGFPVALRHTRLAPGSLCPRLQQTLDHYLKALQPIVSEEEWTQTKQLVEEFQTAGGVGERLQKGLERRARKMENWVSEKAGGDLGPFGACGG